MSDDLDSICQATLNNSDDVQLIKELLESQYKEHEELTYFEREEKKAKIRDAKRKSKESFEKIKVSKEIADIWYEISNYLDNKSDMSNHWKNDYMGKADKAFDNGDIETLDMIYDEIRQPVDKRNLAFYKDKILQSIGCDISEIEDILDLIKNYYEAEIVLVSVEGSDWITKLPKQYPVKPIYSKYTYSDQVKLHRRMLEKDLQEIGVGIRRAQKISQILLSV